MFICQKSEGVGLHPYLLKCCRGTCSFVGMLKGYMVRKRLGTPGLIGKLTLSSIKFACNSCCQSLMFTVTYVAYFEIRIVDINPCCDELLQCLKLSQLNHE